MYLDLFKAFYGVLKRPILLEIGIKMNGITEIPLRVIVKSPVVVSSGLHVVGAFTAEVDVSSGLHVVTGTPQIVKTGQIKPITNASGGEVLDSGPVLSLGIKAHYDNSGDIYVGGNTIDNYPYSGYGLLLKAGGSVNMDIDNFNKFYVVSVISGDKVTYMGVL